MRPTIRAAAVLTFALAAASARAGDDVHVLHGPLADGDGVAVTGVVHAPGAGVVKVALVRRAWMSPQSWSSSWCHGVPSEIALKDGERFRFDRLVPGTFDVGASADGFADDKRDVNAFADVTDVELRPAPAATVKIAVSLGFDGKVEETWVNVVGSDACIVGSGKPKDGFVHVGGFGPGRYWITAEHGDRFGRERTRESAMQVEVKPGANECAIEVLEAADVRLLAASKNAGEPIEGTLRCRDLPSWHVDAPFRARWKGAEGMQGMDSMGHGLFWMPAAPRVPLEGLTAGSWTLTIDALGFAPWERRVELKARTDLDVQLDPLPGRYVVLPAESGGQRDFAMYADVRPEKAVAWSPLLTEDERFKPTHSNQTLSTRAFLAPGKYVVSLHTPNDPPTRQTLDVTSDRTTVVLDGAPSGGGRALRGLAKTRGGAVAGGFLVHVLVQDGDAWRALRAKACVAGEDGAFVVHGLPSGKCRLAFDEAGAFVFGEVEIADKDVESAFVVPTATK